MQVVLTSTDPSEICINGMSFSRRSSRWANAALVVTVSSKDLEALNFRGPLAGVQFQVTLVLHVLAYIHLSFKFLEQFYLLSHSPFVYFIWCLVCKSSENVITLDSGLITMLDLWFISSSIIILCFATICHFACVLI